MGLAATCHLLFQKGPLPGKSRLPGPRHLSVSLRLCQQWVLTFYIWAGADLAGQK